MKTVKINRARWIRGPIAPAGLLTYLWDKDRNAGCCRGHVCKQISRKTEVELDKKAEPDSVFKGASILTGFEDDYTFNNDFADKAMHINDSSCIKEPERERKLIALFKKNGIKLTFYN